MTLFWSYSLFYDARHYLDQRFPGKWTGRVGLISWLAPSLDGPESMRLFVMGTFKISRFYYFSCLC